jgi:ribosomal protein S18 acetylase RimI-like enzyme
MGNGPRPLRAIRMSMSRAHIGAFRRAHEGAEETMYRLPSDDRTLRRSLRGSVVYLVYDGVDCLIGTFSLTRVHPLVASVGIAIAPDARNMGLGSKVVPIIEKVALGHGYTTLRCDIYSDNDAALSLVRAAGFREFRWFERNLTLLNTGHVQIQ